MYSSLQHRIIKTIVAHEARNSPKAKKASFRCIFEVYSVSKQLCGRKKVIGHSADYDTEQVTVTNVVKNVDYKSY